jgi:hypothetical protein
LALNAPDTVNLMLDKIGIGLVTEHRAAAAGCDFNRTMKEDEEGILLFKAECLEQVSRRFSAPPFTLNGRILPMAGPCECAGDLRAE